MNQLQLDAMFALMGSGRTTPAMKAAVTEYLQHPSEQKALCARHGVTTGGFNQSRDRALRVKRLAYQLITGMEPPK